MAAEQYTKVTRTGCLSNIFNSIIGAFLGVLLFFGSFFVLWLNEGKINWAQVAGTSLAVDAAAVRPEGEGRFVAATGELRSDERVGDPPYLQAGNYIKLVREAEMFAWQEDENSETDREVGGGSTTRTTYEYERVWTSSPQDSSGFEFPEGHTNPQQSVESAELVVRSAHVGAYEIQTDAIELPSGDPLALNEDMLGANEEQELVGDYIFIGRGTLERPQVGDIRLQYSSVPNGADVTAFGVQQGSALVPYLHRGESQFYRALEGSRAAAIDQLQAEYDMLTWLLRIGGFLMMWFGLSLAFGPITSVLNVLPALGTVSGCALGGISFAIALPLSIITVLIAIVAHNPLLLILTLLLIAGGVFLFAKLRSRPAAAPA